MRRSFALAMTACMLSAGPAQARERGPVPAPPETMPWVAVHQQTGLWSGHDRHARFFGFARLGARYQIAEPQQGPRLHVWDPVRLNYAFIDDAAVGPASVPRPEELIPIVEPLPPPRVIWSGLARVTMYTCYELGGCNRTRSGIWPYEGIVAVDPFIIPLGSTVWLDGLGIFLAADTGALVSGNRIDVYVDDYSRARRWGVQYLDAAAYRDP